MDSRGGAKGGVFEVRFPRLPALDAGVRLFVGDFIANDAEQEAKPGIECGETVVVGISFTIMALMIALCS